MRVAIIGSGISGLSSAFFLAKNHKVDIFEKNNRLGGHTHTHKINLEINIKVRNQAPEEILVISP